MGHGGGPSVGCYGHACVTQAVIVSHKREREQRGTRGRSMRGVLCTCMRDTGSHCVTQERERSAGHGGGPCVGCYTHACVTKAVSHCVTQERECSVGHGEVHAGGGMNKHA